MYVCTYMHVYMDVHTWGYPNSWMLYFENPSRKIGQKGSLGVPPYHLVGGFNASEKYESIRMIILNIWQIKVMFQSTNQLWTRNLH